MKMKNQILTLFAAIFIANGGALAHAAPIKPTPNFTIEGIPEIDDAIVAKTKAYTDFSPRGFVAWHPVKREMLINMRAGNAVQIHRITEPMGKPEQLTDYKEPVRGALYEPTEGQYIIFAKDEGGNEEFKLYRMNLSDKQTTQISPSQMRAGNPVFSKDGKQFAFTATTLDKFTESKGDVEKIATTRLYLIDPATAQETSTRRVLATFEGGRVTDIRFSPDGKHLLYNEYFANDKSSLWMIDIRTSLRTKLDGTAPEGADDDAAFANNGKAVWSASNRGQEFRRITKLDIATGKRERFLTDIKWDVERVAVPDAALEAKGTPYAFSTNEDGVSVLRLFNPSTGKTVGEPLAAKLPKGVMGGISWHKKKPELSFSLASARSPGEVYSVDTKSGVVTQWTKAELGAIDPTQFVEPKIIRWKSFDGLEISGFYYAPDATKFPGKRPVMVNIHGGPEAQSRAGFIARNNYYLNELGVALIYPNVRGSTGFGRTFAKLDNDLKREDSVKDIGALFDWIKTNEQASSLDVDRILVAGGSYGGYMSLAVSFHYADRIAGAFDSVGISHFTTFLKNTESYRRDLRRVEYGDERKPDIAEFFEKIAPLNNAQKIKKPLFIVQGKNDPRVPYTEALQIRDKVKANGTTVWFLMADDEGHGFAKRGNSDFLFYSTVEFAKSVLKL